MLVAFPHTTQRTLATQLKTGTILGAGLLIGLSILSATTPALAQAIYTPVRDANGKYSTPQTNGISATANNYNGITIETVAGATVTTATGAAISTSTVGGTTIIVIGDTVTGSGTGQGILATSTGAEISIEVNAAVDAPNSTAIEADTGASAAAIFVRGNANITGAIGISAKNADTGLIDIVTSAGTITSTGSGIATSAKDGDTNVALIGVVVAGGTGVNAKATGTGAIDINTFDGGTVESKSGTAILTSAASGATTMTLRANVTGQTDGVVAIATGSGSIEITTETGATVASSTGIGIKTESKTGGDTTLTVNGDVNGGTSGISSTAAGLGAISITTSAGTTVSGGTEVGIETVAANGNTSLTVNGTVAGKRFGITSTATGSGAITITTAAGTTMTGETGAGIATNAADGNTILTVNGDVSAWDTGISSTATGTGTISITTAAGSTVSKADIYGRGIAQFGIATSAKAGGTTLNVSGAVTGTQLGIDSSSEGPGAGAISMTIRNGAVVTGGIRATSSGGAISITTVGGSTVTGTTESRTDGVGIWTKTETGATSVTVGGSVKGEGLYGVYSEATGTGAITITTLADSKVEGITDSGIYTTGKGATTLSLGGKVEGAKSGVVSNATGAGTILITTQAGATVTGTDEVGIKTTGAGATTLQLNGTVKGGTSGVLAAATGTGTISITTTAGSKVEGTSTTGIYTSAEAGAVVVDVGGEVTGGAVAGVGSYLTGNGTVSITIQGGGTVKGPLGIAVTSEGTGTISITTKAGSKVTGEGDGDNALFAGILGVSGGDQTLDLGGSVTGKTYGIASSAGGALTITARAVAVISGGNAGIFTQAEDLPTTISIAAGALVTGGTYALDLSTKDGAVAVANAGTLDGSIKGRIQSNGTGTFTLTNAGTVKLGAGQSITGFATTNAAGGMLTGTGHFGDVTAQAGSFIRPGDHSLAPVGGVPVTGPLTTGALTMAAGVTLEIRADASGAHDKVVATGAAVLGGATLKLLASPADRAAWSTQKTYTVLMATSVSGTFALTTDLAFLTPAATYTATEVDITMTRNEVSYDAPAQTPNQKSVGVAIQSAQGGASSPQGQAFLRVMNNQTTAQVPSTLDTLSGVGMAGPQSVNIGQMAAFTSAVTGQGQNLLRGSFSGTASGPSAFSGSDMPLAYADPKADKASSDAFKSVKAGRNLADLQPAQTWRVWGTFFGASSNTQANTAANTPGVTAHDWGGAAGLEFAVSPNLVAGVSLGGSTSPFSVGKRATTGDTTGGLGAVYGTATFDNAYVSGALSYGRFGTNATRTISVPGAPLERQTADYDSDAYAGMIEIGYRMPVQGYVLTPFVAFQPMMVHQHAATERSDTVGALFGLSYGSRNTTSLPVSLGLQVERGFALSSGWNGLVEARAAWVHEFEPSRDMSASFIALPGSTFVASGTSASENLARLSATVTFANASGFSLFAKVGAYLSSTQRSVLGQGGIKIAW